MSIRAQAHCVSRCLGMGKGIATVFKSSFGGVDILRRQNKRIGEVAVLHHDKSGSTDGTDEKAGADGEGRFVYYLITKEKYWNKPTYDAVRASLEDLRAHALKYKVCKSGKQTVGKPGLLYAWVIRCVWVVVVVVAVFLSASR